MRFLRCSLPILLAVLTVGCGDDDSVPPSPDTGGVDAGGGEDAGDGEDAATGLDAGGGTDAATTDGGSGEDAAMGDAGLAEIVLSDVAVYGNCMPVVDPDPIIAFWTVTISGASDTSATLSDAELTIDDGAGATFVQKLTVDTPTFPLTAGAGTTMQRKVDADATSPDACGSFCTAADVTWTLRLTYEIGGTTQPVSAIDTYGCVY